MADVHQSKHILGPAAYAALALELENGDPNIGDGEVRWAIEHVPSEVRDILLQMPALQTGRSRLDSSSLRWMQASADGPGRRTPDITIL